MHFCLSALHAQPRVVSVAQASRIISKGNCRLAPTIFGHHPRCRSRIDLDPSELAALPVRGDDQPSWARIGLNEQRFGSLLMVQSDVMLRG
jgi:hypothetical protein